MKRLALAVLLAMAVVVAPLVSMGSADALPTANVQNTGQFRAILVINYDDGHTYSSQLEVMPNGEGPSGAYLHCNTYYPFTDFDGTYTIQHTCGGSTGPWSFRISGSVCALATSSVAEAGMDWTLNGVKKSRQAPHSSEGCGYLYHGTYNPLHDYDHISYSDTMTFKVHNGHAGLHIFGDFTMTGSPCSPTSC